MNKHDRLLSHKSQTFSCSPTGLAHSLTINKTFTNIYRRDSVNFSTDCIVFPKSSLWHGVCFPAGILNGPWVAVELVQVRTAAKEELWKWIAWN